MNNTADEISRRELRRRRLMRRTGSVAFDIYASILLHPLWRALAWEDLRQRYRRSTLGLAWMLISFLLMIVIFVLIFGRTSPGKTQAEYTLYLSSGLIIWNFLSGIVSKGVTVFGGNGPWIRSTPAPFTVLVLRNLYSSMLEAGLTFLVVIPIVIYCGVPSLPLLGVALFALLLYVIAAVPVSLLLGCIGAWSADFQQLVPAIMRIAFFATPIFWDYETRGGMRIKLAHYNPFTHFLEIFRSPLLGHYPTTANWVVVFSATAMVWIVAILAFKFFRPRLAAWV